MPLVSTTRFTIRLKNLLVCGWMAWAVLPAVSQSVTARTLACTRNGKEIGSETISVDRNAERSTMKMSVHLQVKMLGITVYRFDQDSSETWTADQFQELTSDTSDNGKHHSLHVRRQGTVLQLKADQKDSTIDPASLPASFWYEPHFHTATLIHNVDGHLMHVMAQRVGTETLSIGGAEVEANHYRLSGDLTDDLWFDSGGVIVQRRSTSPDHSVIQFTMR